MIGIEVDGVTAALDGDGALCLTVCVVRRRGEEATTVEVELGGHADGESRTWIKEDLPVGATLTVRIVDTNAGDPPHRVRRLDPDRIETAERREYERLKRKYEG